MSETTDEGFVERIRLSAMAWSGVAGCMVGAIGLIVGEFAFGLIFFVAGAILMWFSSAQYTVDERDLVVRVGAGWPRLVVSLRDVSDVEVTTLSVVRAGGWGYRGSWRLMKGVAISLGGSGAVLVRTVDGRRLVMSSAEPRRLSHEIRSRSVDHDDETG